MNKQKQELKKFLVWMRNGVSFAATWFLILLLAASYGLGVTQLPVTLLSKILVLSIGGVFLFCVNFTKLVFPKWSFMKRLTLFVAAMSVYQVAGFYWVGLFRDPGTVAQWGIYAGILLAGYFCCILIYHAYYSKNQKIYTQALNEYQKKREGNRGE